MIKIIISFIKNVFSTKIIRKTKLEYVLHILDLLSIQYKTINSCLKILGLKLKKLLLLC